MAIGRRSQSSVPVEGARWYQVEPRLVRPMPMKKARHAHRSPGSRITAPPRCRRTRPASATTANARLDSTFSPPGTPRTARASANR